MYKLCVFTYLDRTNAVDLVYGYTLRLCTVQTAELFVFKFDLQYVGSKTYCMVKSMLKTRVMVA